MKTVEMHKINQLVLSFGFWVVKIQPAKKLTANGDWSAN
jgi:hypothetical protein